MKQLSLEPVTVLKTLSLLSYLNFPMVEFCASVCLTGKITSCCQSSSDLLQRYGNWQNVSTVIKLTEQHTFRSLQHRNETCKEFLELRAAMTCKIFQLAICVTAGVNLSLELLASI